MSQANAILPGSVNTQLLQTVSVIEGERNGRTAEEQQAYWLADYPSGAYTQPEEIAEMCVRRGPATPRGALSVLSRWVDGSAHGRAAIN